MFLSSGYYIRLVNPVFSNGFKEVNWAITVSELIWGKFWSY